MITARTRSIPISVGRFVTVPFITKGYTYLRAKYTRRARGIIEEIKYDI